MICDKCNNQNKCKKIVNIYELTCNRFRPNLEYVNIWRNKQKDDIIYFVEKTNLKSCVIRETKIVEPNSLKDNIENVDIRIHITGMGHCYLHNMNMGTFYPSKKDIIECLKNNKKYEIIVLHTYDDIKVYRKGDLNNDLREL